MLAVSIFLLGAAVSCQKDPVRTLQHINELGE